MAQKAFDLACIASLLACIGTLTMWQRSYRGCDVLIAQRGPADHVTCTSELGEIVFEREDPQRGLDSSRMILLPEISAATISQDR